MYFEASRVSPSAIDELSGVDVLCFNQTCILIQNKLTISDNSTNTLIRRYREFKEP
jgi:magnesium-transporting ATPase (P-type)